MKILIAPDSFKESLKAIDVCAAIESGISQVLADAVCQLLPMADGGEGTAQALSYALTGQWLEVPVHDPLLRKVTARYLLLEDGTAVIEIAQACGLHLLAVRDRDPLLTSSFGVGEMIKDALDKGATRLIMALGGSATNDAGMGMLCALGARFYDTDGQPLNQGGAALAKLASIDDSGLDQRLHSLPITVACDVSNPLCGPYGASAIFAPQKGATPEQVRQLDEALARFAQVADACAVEDSDAPCHQAAGAGAAGGLGFALMRFCQAQLRSGFDILSETLGLEDAIATADLVITGEGKLDRQSAMGKVVGAITELAQAHQVPVIAICGSVEASASEEQHLAAVFPSIQKVAELDEVMATAYANIEATARNVALTMRLGSQLPIG